MATYKFDIFAALRAVDKNDGDWFSKQPEDVRSAFVAPLFLRYAAGVDADGIQHEMALMTTNEFLNINADSMMTTHPELMFRLAAMCGTGKKRDRIWIAGQKKGFFANKAAEVVSSFNPSASDSEIDMLLSLHTKETFKEFIDSAGLSPEDAKEAIKVFNKSCLK